MPLNGSGVYSPPSASYPIQNGTLGDALQVDAIIADMSTAISQAVMKDGQQTMTANLPMNGFKVTGAASGTSRTDGATIANMQDGTGVYVSTVTGGANTIVLSPSPAIASYTEGLSFKFVPNFTNTGAVTIAVSGLAAKDLQALEGTAVIAGDIRTGDMVEITYTGSVFVLSGAGPVSERTAKTLSGCILENCLVTAQPTNGLGIANKGYVDDVWKTGDVKVTLRPTPDTGWLIFDDGTIGSASSGATTRANADTEDLFNMLWAYTSDSNCAVSGGRGSSGPADFAANKTIALPKVLGRALAMAGAGSGLTSRALATALGSEDAINVSHTHGTTDAGHSHTYTVTTGGTGGFTNTVAAGVVTGGGGGGPTATATTGLTVNSSGSSGTGANIQPTIFFFVHVKL